MSKTLDLKFSAHRIWRCCSPVKSTEATPPPSRLCDRSLENNSSSAVGTRRIHGDTAERLSVFSRGSRSGLGQCLHPAPNLGARAGSTLFQGKGNLDLKPRKRKPWVRLWYKRSVRLDSGSKVHGGRVRGQGTGKAQDGDSQSWQLTGQLTRIGHFQNTFRCIS